MTSTVFNWNDLGLGEEEDPKEVQARLDRIYKDLLEERGLATKPQANSPGFRPTVDQARQVSVMACLGLDPKDIALVVNVELKLLKLYYAKELKVPAMLANAMVARTAFQMAVSGRSADMTKFWLRAQAGWNDVQKIDVTSNGKTLEGSTAKDRLKDVLDRAGPKRET